MQQERDVVEGLGTYGLYGGCDAREELGPVRNGAFRAGCKRGENVEGFNERGDVYSRNFVMSVAVC